MRLPGRGRQLPDGIRSALGAGRGERVLDWASDVHGTVLVATSTHLYAVADGVVAVSGPWHLVDAARWNRDTSTLTVTWVSGQPRARWVLEEGRSFLQVLRERVQASVVLAEEVGLGDRGSARVVIRRDLRSGRLLGQTVLGRGVRLEDPGVREATAAVLADLKEQVGLE